MFSALFGTSVRKFMLNVGVRLDKHGISPNSLTVVGLLLNGLVALVLATGHYTIGGILTLLAGIFDMLDGAVARAGNRISTFGGFLDSTLDRYSEAILMFGLLIHFLRSGNMTGSALIYAATVGALITSYARARAEAAGLKNESGFFQRPERVILLGVLLIFEHPVIALWILAVGTNLTAVYRIWAVYRATHYNEPSKADRA